MATDNDICNMALSHLGVGVEISDLNNDTTPEAKACRQFYATARDMVLRSFKWPFANRLVTLALVQSSPTTEWGFSYRYPSDALLLHRIPSVVRNDLASTRMRYKITADNTGELIYTDAVSAAVEYTARVTDSSKFPPDFVIALSYYLAFLIATRLTGGDYFKFKESCYQAYMLSVNEAKVSALNEEQPDVQFNSELMAARL